MCSLRCRLINYVDSHWPGPNFSISTYDKCNLSRYSWGEILCRRSFSTSCLRNVLALGSPLAFPGSMIGAWLSAYLYKKYNAIWAAALGEIIGTGLIGALVSYPIAHFLLGKPLALLTLITSFSMSSIAGACIGFVVLQILSRRNLLHKEA